MQNRILANDWLEDGKKHLDVACTMQKDSYYNDIVGLELQQAIERVFKSVLAFNNKKITRTHDLAVLLEEIKPYLYFNIEVLHICQIATDYYIDKRYPGGGINFIPKDDEIKLVTLTAENIYNTINEYINKK
jgi:HEPN domain-containing protein